ncbi:serine hydrolase domain-containing protein [Methylovirgula sp. 4M-Z18]|uniref:serine hydrolase domain-containing protein n=1 Tax=Methylovirgula sp. 4M-Z18 TaxID=2293567 RepID=UPI000E2EED82|nr:serine hydrolase domain-containing protein [Methylovirgula sp. 4M-Z18]RFB79539.1 class A beta-lactamase-related serine hydrolase [Methylovirgula sp. 4M-Z18]
MYSDLSYAPGLATGLDAVIDRAIAEERIVGTVVLVARAGAIVFRRAAGFADREAARPMREDDIFLLASITKPIVTAAAMRLVEENVIGLDDPVTRWLPDFRPRLPDGTAPTITLRQLLTHTAGLSYSFTAPSGEDFARLGVSDGLAEPGLPLSENLARLSQVPLASAPGAEWRYSLAMDVLGGVLEAATGMSLPAVVARQVADPLHLKDTGFQVTDVRRLVTHYADGNPTPVLLDETIRLDFAPSLTFAPKRIFDPNSYPSGGAGMAGTAGDILRFLETIRQGGAPILQPKTVKAMVTNQLDPRAETRGPGWGFSYGWAVLEDPAGTATPQSKGTLQWGGAYGHSWFVDPVRQLSVVALTNTAFAGMQGAFPDAIRDAVYA